MRKKKGLPVEEGLKRCGNTPDGHFSARPIPRDPGISPCTNDRQVSWLSGHHSTAPSHFRNGILRHYSPVHSDEIVQDLHLFPFNPLTRGLRGQRHPSFCVFGSISLYHACEKKQSFFTSVTVVICRIPPSSTNVILSQNRPALRQFHHSIFFVNFRHKPSTKRKNSIKTCTIQTFYASMFSKPQAHFRIKFSVKLAFLY